MADLRTNFPIPANTWVKVLSGSLSATIYKEKSTPEYMSLLYGADVGTDDPNTLLPLDFPTSKDNQTPPTSQKIFSDGLIEEHASSVATYYWIACKSGKAGSVVATP